MAKSLPDSIDIVNAIRKSWLLSGTILLSDFNRLPAHLVKVDDQEVKFEMAFEPSSDIMGLAHITIESKIELICQRSLEHFDYKIKVNKTIGLINREEDEGKLFGGVAPSWVESGTVDPKTLLEDELLLVIPEFPLKPGATIQSEYLADETEQETAEDTYNPFAALKDLK